jgi:hypothetical protein
MMREMSAGDLSRHQKQTGDGSAMGGVVVVGGDGLVYEVDFFSVVDCYTDIITECTMLESICTTIEFKKYDPILGTGSKRAGRPT